MKNRQNKRQVYEKTKKSKTTKTYFYTINQSETGEKDINISDESLAIIFGEKLKK